MASNQKLIYVYDAFSFDKDVLLGTFYVDVVRGGESYSFEYDSEWLKKTKYSVSLDPDFSAYSLREPKTIRLGGSVALFLSFSSLALQASFTSASRVFSIRMSLSIVYS